MHPFFKFFLFCFAFIYCSTSIAQSINVTGDISGKSWKAVKEILFYCDGKVQKLVVNKLDSTFSGNIKLIEPQFVEIKSGNSKPLNFYLVPNEKIIISIIKPSLAESKVIITNKKVEQLQQIFNSFYDAIQEKGIDIKTKDWPKLIFNNTEIPEFAAMKLNEAIIKNKILLTKVPNFKKDASLFVQFFKNYLNIDKMSLTEIESNLEMIKEAKLKKTALNIPYLKDYLTDLTNAYAAGITQKYTISIDYLKQRHITQFIAAESISKYIKDSVIKSFLFSEKLNIEIPTNGIKNENFVNFLYDHSNQTIKDEYKARLDLLKANKLPDINAPRKKAFNFLLHDASGKPYRLDDFKGKMLFLDFWASWCAPCKIQIPYQKELEKMYEGKDIIFANVSLDASKEDWLKAVKDEDLHGFVLHAEGDFKNDLPKTYSIQSIPRYILIDANGYIISDNMMKPQYKKEITSIFDSELYSKNTVSILENHFKAIGAKLLINNGLAINYRQSVMGFVSQNNIWYNFPDQLKFTNQLEKTDQLSNLLDNNQFKENYAIVNGTKFTTNNSNFSNVKQNIANRIYGFELFLRKTLNNAVIKLADENNNNTENCHVLKLLNGGNTEKYFINKTTYLIDKIIITSNIDPRQGGGTYENFVSYTDYRNINGIMVPFKINQGNLNTLKVEKAELKLIDPVIFNF